MHINEEASLKEAIHTVWLQLYDILEKGNYGDSKKKISGFQWLEGERDEWAEHRGFLGQWNYSVQYHNGGYVSLYICENSKNVQHQEWTLI